MDAMTKTESLQEQYMFLTTEPSLQPPSLAIIFLPSWFDINNKRSFFSMQEKIIPYLLRLRQVKDETLQAAVREILALIGYVDPVKGRGIRILTIDGGGTR